ncbi:NADH:flavin oxidoreductase [Mycobacterium sp. 1245852.3]|uniref:oxidoreductase n=1 Tax=Mycobacterium sp. 1245852.3 TaxID=1856860 RepID=UPI0007FB91C6|nr:NADH:flavin oxidoreductase [Mycobacterium sp. 1245852.3]OBJ83306.1 NADH:flavin oxidoreductase [Mycobacterium sp. 1245852.3]
MPDDAELSGVLFSPLTINSVTIANRIVMSPMAALASLPDGRPSEQSLAFLAERAKGGVGLVILGGTVATRRGYDEAAVKGLLRFDDDRFVSDLKRLTDTVHVHGTSIFAELTPGFGTMAKSSPEWPLIAASPKNVVIRRDRLPTGIISPTDVVTPVPREATVDEIHQIEQDTAMAAVRAQRAGFDGVEVAAMMSYFLASFLSPRSNWRTDEYGGDLENRARILVNIVRLIRERTGPSFPIGLRISANEHVEGGQGPEGFAAIAQRVHREGLDYVALTDGNYESMDASNADTPTVAHGEAQIFREAVSCPLMIGSVHSHRSAARAISEGRADAVMIARQLLADPEYANKIRDGRTHEIVQCDHNNVCMRRLALGMAIRCSLNPRMGRESRQPGERPPIDRIIKAPIEQAVLAATGSQRLMNLVGNLPRKRR